MRNSLSMCSFIGCCFLLVSTGIAATEADPRVKSALESVDVSFTEVQGHDFRAKFKTTEDRKNLVIVKSSTEKDGEYEHREIWAPVCHLRETRKNWDEIRVLLLQRNQPHQTGGFRLLSDPKDEGNSIIMYSAIVPADASGEVLKSVMETCASNADNLEAAWTNRDDY